MVGNTCANHGCLKSINFIAVYDLTTFISDHPGGIEALQSSAGADGTEAYDYAGHSQENMVKMQQYRIGRLDGSLEQDTSASYRSLPVETGRIGSAMSSFKHVKISGWTKLAITTIAMSSALALPYHRMSSTVKIPQFQFGNTTDQRMGYAFWSGTALASSFSLVVFRHFYKLFLSTLDHQDDVFSFPPTIPRKTRK